MAKRTGKAHRLRSIGLRRGILGGSAAWTAIAAVTYGMKALRWALRPDHPVVITESIEPGQTLVVTHLPPPLTRKQRRRARRS